MKLESEQFITLPQRGLRVLAPEETQRNMIRAKAGEVVLYSEEEKKRLNLLTRCRILKKRYPTPDSGAEFMREIDHKRRKQLFVMAQEMSDETVIQWHRINPNLDIAVILYGSVSKGLVKRPDHPDPSNIDLAVIGSMQKEEQEMLYDAIRPKRKELQRRILGTCPELNSTENNPGNVGVIIQPIEKLTIENYSQTRSYITACARPLYDKSDIWRTLESLALDAYNIKRSGKHHKK